MNLSTKNSYYTYQEYEISSNFPKQPEDSLKHLIDYRIQLKSTEQVTFEPLESRLLSTAFKVTSKPGDLCIHLKRSETLPLTFESDGFISPNYRGQVYVKLVNYSNEVKTIPEGTVVGYIILQSFAIE